MLSAFVGILILGIYSLGLSTGETYTLFLFINALQYTFMLGVCVNSLILNHLVQRVRILMRVGAYYAFSVGIDQWIRAFGRLQNEIAGKVSTQANASLALSSLILWTFGTFVLLMGISYLSWSGKVELPNGEVPKRKGDPK